MSAHKKGEIFTATVRDVASDGRGILSHPDGLTVFVPGVWPGEECRVRFIGLQNRIGLGEVIEIIKASSRRVSPGCSHHGFMTGDCGGCPWQFIDYKEQLATKQVRVNKAFERLNFFVVDAIWPSDTEYNYRNRAQLKTDGKVIGYLSPNSNDLAPIQQCPILTEANQHTLKQLLAKLPNEEWLIVPQPPKRRLQWTTLNIDDSRNAGEVLINRRLPFQQSNHQQNERMRNWLTREIKQLENNGPVLELFCGTGNFTEVIAANTNQDIIAVEGDRRALESLREKSLERVTTVEADLFKETSFESIAKHRHDFSVLVLDPPRDGMKHSPALLDKFSSIKTIFYISCNLATLCRDLDQICQRGFNLQIVQPLDQTPHTPHIEVLVKLQKT